MPLSKKRNRERMKEARREARSKGRILSGDRGKPVEHSVTKKDVQETNGMVREATARWVDAFLCNLHYPARATYLVIDKVVEPETGEILWDMGAMESRISALELLTARLGEHIIQLTWQIAELQADAIGPGLDAEEQEALDDARR